MVANIASILVLIATTANLSLAAPAPAPYQPPRTYRYTTPAPPNPIALGTHMVLDHPSKYAYISYRAGRFGERETAAIGLWPRNADGSVASYTGAGQRRDGRFSDFPADKPLYDVIVHDGPLDVTCGFHHRVSSLPEWVPGQTRSERSEERVSLGNHAPGPIKDVEYMYCMTEAEMEGEGVRVVKEEEEGEGDGQGQSEGEGEVEERNEDGDMFAND